MTLTFDSKVISVIRNVRCNLHGIDNHCVKHEHPRSKFKGRFGPMAVTAYPTFSNTVLSFGGRGTDTIIYNLKSFACYLADSASFFIHLMSNLSLPRSKTSDL